jgi:hypothetical protein
LGTSGSHLQPLAPVPGGTGVSLGSCARAPGRSAAYIAMGVLLVGRDLVTGLSGAGILGFASLGGLWGQASAASLNKIRPSFNDTCFHRYGIRSSLRCCSCPLGLLSARRALYSHFIRENRRKPPLEPESAWNDTPLRTVVSSSKAGAGIIMRSGRTRRSATNRRRQKTLFRRRLHGFTRRLHPLLRPRSL